MADVEQGGRIWKGCIALEIPADMRDIQMDRFNIQYHEGAHEAVLTKPILPACFWEDATQYEARQANDAIKKGHQACRASFATMDGSERVEKFVLRFGPGFKITQAPFVTGAGLDPEKPDNAEQKMVTYKQAVGVNDAGGQPLYVLHSRLTFKFANSSTSVPLDGANKRGAQAARDGLAGL